MSDSQYISEFSNLINEWDWEKNSQINLIPDNLLSGSNKIAWWKCTLGHEWKARIIERARNNTGCPYCTNRKIQIGFNDLATTNPDLAKEWHPQKNVNISPYKVTKGSSKKVWWLCINGHEWQASIASRASGRGCPFCSNNKILAGFNDLATTHPTLVNEWNYKKNESLSPSAVLAGSSKKVWWKCKNGHEWQASISHRSDREQGCPFCSGRNAIAGETDLATINPKLASEWHPTKNGNLTPAQVTIRSGKKIWWLCRYGHEWQATPHDRDTDNTKCPICSARQQTSFPEQAIFYYVKKLFPNTINRYKDIFHNSMELDVFIPDIALGIEYDGANWHKTQTEYSREKNKYEICKNHGIYLIRIKENHKNIWNDVADKIIYIEKRRNFTNLNRIISTLLDYILCFRGNSDNSASLYHNITIDVKMDQTEILNYLTDIDNSLKELRPDLVEEWDWEKNGHLQPSMFSLHSNDIVWWKCKQCGRSWRAMINTRTRNSGSGCAICGIPKRAKSFHDAYISVNGSLMQNNSKLAEEWHPTHNGDLTPDNITVASPRKVWWLCKKCGHEWQAPPNNRNKGVGCPRCSGRIPKIGVNDLATVNPDLAKEWHPTLNAPMLPNEFLPKSSKKVWWLCPRCRHEWKAFISNRSKGAGCPCCSGQVAKIGVNDLATVNPTLAKEWHPTKNEPLKPDTVLPNCSKKVWWKCPKCAHEWQATVSSRSNKRGCPNCYKIKISHGNIH